MTQPAILGEMARGSAVMIVMRWSMRLIGLVSTMILARLLTPQDFGVVAMATVFVGFIELFSFMSFDLALIRMQEPDREDYDTAWTLQAILGAVLGLVILVLAPIAAWYFDDLRLATVIRLLAANSVLQGLTNIGLADFRRNLDFQRDLRFNVYAKLIVFVATMAVAVPVRNYWALVAGLLVGNTARLVLSYAMHPYRPRFRLSRSREILSFSSWMLLFHVGTHLRNRLDTILVARLTAASSVGIYHVASELSSMPTNELVMPTGRALFPAYAQLAHDPGALRTAFQAVLGFFFSVVIPVCAGVMVVSPYLVRVILGEQWMDAAPLVSMLTFAGGFGAISHVIGTFHAAHGRERFTAALTWINVLLLAPALFLGAKYGGVPGIALGRVAVSCAILALAAYSLALTSPITGKDMFQCFWRPALASVAMVAVLASARLAFASPFVSLVANSVAGVCCFAAAYYGLWWVSGRPPGVESMGLDALQALVRRARRSSAQLPVRTE